MAMQRGTRSNPVTRSGEPVTATRLEREAEGMLGRVKGTLESGVDTVQNGIGTVRDNITGGMSGHPFVTAGIALGAGLAAGFAARHALDEAIGGEIKVLGMPRTVGSVVAPIGGLVLGVVGPALVREVQARLPERFGGEAEPETLKR